MSVDFTTRAVDLFKKGAGHDEAKEYEEAYKWYMESIDVFMTAIKYENKNPTKKDMLKKKVKEIMERAEKIKEYLDNAKDTPQQGQAGRRQQRRQARARRPRKKTKIRRGCAVGLKVRSSV